MYDLKVNKRGQLVIPKTFLKKIGLQPNFSVHASCYNNEITIIPTYRCFYCRKPLPDELSERNTCLTCPSEPPLIKLY